MSDLNDGFDLGYWVDLSREYPGRFEKEWDTYMTQLISQLSPENRESNLKLARKFKKIRLQESDLQERAAAMKGLVAQELEGLSRKMDAARHQLRVAAGTRSGSGNVTDLSWRKRR